MAEQKHSDSYLDEIAYALDEKFRTQYSEIIQELIAEYYIDRIDPNDAYHVFKNGKKNGLIDKAKNILVFALMIFMKWEIRNVQICCVY